MERRDNYTLARLSAQRLFAACSEDVVRTHEALRADGEYFYFPLLGREYRIRRADGGAELARDGEKLRDADFNEALSLYDILSRPAQARLSGRFVLMASLSRLHTSEFSGGFFRAQTAAFARDYGRWAAACDALGRRVPGNGADNWEFALWPSFPLRLSYDPADEDFPAQLRLYWDENTLQFVHYETTYYLAGILFARLREEAEK